VLYLSLDHGRFGKLKGLMLVSGRRGVTVTADDIRLRRRTVDMQVDQITVQATTRQDRIVFHEPATLVFHMRNNGDYPLFRQHFELIPADRNRDRIHIGRAVDSIGQIEPGQTFAVTFELSAGLVLPADSVRFRLCTPLHGDWQRIPVAVATVSLFDAVRPSLPDPDDARQRAVLRHYGRPGVDIGKCVSALRALSGADPMARAWEGMLTSLGQGGFQRDEEAGRWLLRESLPALQAAVLRGEVEAMFLLGNAWWLGLGTAEEAAFAPELLAYAADQGYAPAVLDYGMYQAGRQSYEVGRALLREAYEMGLQKALTYRGILEELDPGSDETPATEWFRQAAAAGDPAAMVLLAERMREDTTGLGRDKAAPDRWLAKAAALGHTGAMRVLSRWYFDGIGSQGRKVAEAVRWLTKAAEGGDRDAMLSLGMLRLEGSLAGGVDTQQGFAWVRQAAEQGQPVAMRLLGGMYAEGAIVAHDPVRSRYWLNQAAGRGEGAGAAQTQQIHPLAAMLDNVVWVEEYQVTNDGRGSTGEVRYVGTDYAASFIQTVLEAYGASRSAPMQEQLNGLVPIRKAGGVDIYAATVASHFRSQLRLPAGGTVVATASGEVQAGFVHRCGPGGHADPYVQAYNYPDAGDILHAALMYRIGEGPWSLLGPGVSFQVPADGLLELAVNDRDYTNNKGYFDVVLAVR
jgi:TPR repeat protein